LTIDVQAAETRDFDDAIVTSGRVAFDDTRLGRVFSPVTGRVVHIGARLGEHVKRGQLLATIESPDVGNAVGDANKALADLIAAENDYRRRKELLAEHAMAEAAVEQAEDTWRRAKAELERARQRAFLLHAGDRSSVTQTYTLASPIDGDVIARNINPGMEVQGQYGGGSQQELFTIGELGQVWVMGDLYESDIGRVQVGSPVAVTVVSSASKELVGTIDWVSTMLDGDTRTAKVRCRLSNVDHGLRPEMFATMRITVERRRAPVAVPRSAVLRLGEYRVVFVRVDDGNTRLRFARVPVEVDAQGTSDTWVEIRHGLETGQRVVVRGAEQLSQLL
jgi:cobalt-zinc-cadmium efflux system membrane fusion protein